MTTYRVFLNQRGPDSADSWSEDYKTLAEAQARVDGIEKEKKSLYHYSEYTITVEQPIMAVDKP